DEPVSVAVTGLGNSARIRLLEETTYALATGDAEAFRAQPGETCATDAGRLDLSLRPFAYARIETASGDHDGRHGRSGPPAVAPRDHQEVLGGPRAQGGGPGRPTGRGACGGRRERGR